MIGAIRHSLASGFQVCNTTGQTIVRAILAGERDSKKLAELSHPQIRATREEIARSLEGNWRPELLFLLKQEMEMYDTYQRRIAECDNELEAHLKSFADNVPPKRGGGITGETAAREEGADFGKNKIGPERQESPWQPAPV
jgi:hypothetical protein